MLFSRDEWCIKQLILLFYLYNKQVFANSGNTVWDWIYNDENIIYI